MGTRFTLSVAGWLQDVVDKGPALQNWGLKCCFYLSQLNTEHLLVVNELPN